ncbi:MAG TPA: tetratricopeptide repeat protein [Wenzhouxiangella sp.]
MAVELYDEHEQGERVRHWLQNNAFTLIVAVALALGGVFGFQQYQRNQVENQSAAASYFNTLQTLIESEQLEMAEDYFAELETLDKSGYYKLGAMTMAKAYVDAGRLGPAVDIYQTLLTRSDIESLRGLIGLRLARLLDGQGDGEAALGVLSGPAPTGYEGAWAEVRGDIYMSLGQIKQARLAYQEALDSPSDMGFGTTLIQMKLDATGPGALQADS